MLVGVIEVTLPVAKPNPVRRADDPGGAVEELPPFGGVRRENAPRPLPVPLPKRPVVQLPAEFAVLRMTVLATSAPLAFDPVTMTQSPAATLAADTVTVLMNVVEDVQLIVTCPVCWFWTSIDDPEMAATEPEAPGKLPPPDPPVPDPLVPEPPPADPLPPEPLPPVVGLVAVLVRLVPPPQALTSTASTSPALAAATRGLLKGFMDWSVLLGLK
jgi:hypothetical protein